MSESPTSAPHARGQRSDWSALPAQTVKAIEAELGAPIASTHLMSGGFSPGIAARIETTTGERAFVKAVSAEHNSASPGFNRREILVNEHLAELDDLPIPRLRWSNDEGGDGWVTLLYDNIDGREIAQPWRDDELDRTITALDQLATRLTPSPVSTDLLGSVRDWSLFRTNFWRDLDTEEARERIDPWTRRNLGRLIELSEDAAEAASGDTLLHLDLRADNMLLTDEQVFVVDWPHARIGAAWLDPLFMAPSVTMHGGPDPKIFFQRCAASTGADPERVTSALAEVAGFFTTGALKTDVPGLPGLRQFQDAQGIVARRWLAYCTGWE